MVCDYMTHRVDAVGSKVRYIIEVRRLGLARSGLVIISGLKWWRRRIVRDLDGDMTSLVVNEVALWVVPVGVLPSTVLVRPIVRQHKAPRSN